MLLDVVTPEQVRELRAKMLAAAENEGRTPPTPAAWLPAAVDPEPGDPHSGPAECGRASDRAGLQHVFTAAGFGEAVQSAATGADHDTLVRALPPAAAGTLGLVGDPEAARADIDACAQAGLDEITLYRRRP